MLPFFNLSTFAKRGALLRTSVVVGVVSSHTQPLTDTQTTTNPALPRAAYEHHVSLQRTRVPHHHIRTALLDALPHLGVGCSALGAHTARFLSLDRSREQ